MTIARLRSLLRTTAMRLALRNAALLVLSLAMLLGALFLALDRYTASEIQSALAGEARALAAMPAEYRAQSVAVLTRLHGERRLRHYRLESATGASVAGDLPAWPKDLPSDSRVRQVALELPRADDDDHDGTAWLPSIGVRLPEGGRLLIAQARGDIEDISDLAFGMAAAILALAALFALVAGLSLGWQWLVRIESLNEVTGRIAQGDLSRRVSGSGHGDEFDLLASHLNAMLTRIEAAVAGMREVSDNVAHDLRRPLTRLKTRIEVALRQPRDTDTYRRVLTEALQDSEEILAAFEALLTIARLEAGSESIEQRTVDLTELVRDVADLYSAEIEAAGREFRIATEADLHTFGSPRLLSQALSNLLDNALKYTPSSSPIEIDLRATHDHARCSVIDHGPGLSEPEKVRLLGRFARGDAARSSPGTGLGLSLVAAIVRAHRGSLTLRDTPGGGLTALVELPLARALPSSPS